MSKTKNKKKTKDETLLEKLGSFLTVENIKFEIMRTAYGNPYSILNGLDPRALIIWYLFASIVPWFFYDIATLTSLFIFAAIVAMLSRVSPLIVGLMAISFVFSTLSTTILVIFFGGSVSAFVSLMSVTLKFLVISLFTVSIFTSIDPEKLGDALRWFGMPEKFCFGISYGYRILPTLIDEYTGIFNSFRLRGNRPNNSGILGWRIFLYYVKMVIKSFYPMILNTALRIKITVEALETRGFTRSTKSKKVMELKFSKMKFTKRDALVLGVMSICLMLTIFVGNTVNNLIGV